MVLYGGMIDQERLDYNQILDFANKYESLDFYSTVVFDHFHPIYSDDDSPYLECWSVLSALARDTSKLKLGSLVTCSSYRHPALAAKISSAVDILSNGRLIFGVGSGWYNSEYESYGFSFLSHSNRLKQMTEFTNVVKSLWVDSSTTFNGDYHSLSKALNYPKPVQKPHPPILIGTQVGGNTILGIIAKLADIANIGWNMDHVTFTSKIEFLKEQVKLAGRPHDSVKTSINLDLLIAKNENDLKSKIKSTSAKFSQRFGSEESYLSKIKNGLIGTPESCSITLDLIKKSGVDMIFLQPLDSPDYESVELFAEYLM